MVCFCCEYNKEIKFASRNGGQLKAHQEKLELAIRENDILFNLE
jgi:hypothetical protein